MSTTPKIALIAGATGLVGGFLLKTLLEAPDYSRVYALTRRPLGKEHPKLANRVVVFERMTEQLKGLVAQDAYCCIGTTIAEAGSQEAFREADVDAVLLFARAARAAQASRFVVISSVGANSGSTKFYLRTKGEMEEAVSDLGFASVDILQPSLLLGPRKALRPLEITGRIFAPLINPLLTGSREAYRAIPAEIVGKAMLGASRRGARGIYRYTYSAIRQLSELRSAQALAPQTPKKNPGLR
ncbi:MAG: NAD(P)H-binding protein [Pseudomonadota bacterium]